MTFKTSLSKIFNQHLEQIKELDSTLNYKRVAKNIKKTAKNLDKLEKSGITLQEVNMKNKVDDTCYSIIYKVKINPKKKLIAKRIIKSKR